MRGGLLLLLLGLFVGWLAVSGKVGCLAGLWDCVGSDNPGDCGCKKTTEVSASSMPSIENSLRELLAPLDIPGVSVWPYDSDARSTAK